MEKESLSKILGLGASLLSYGCANRPTELNLFYSEGDDIPSMMAIDYDGLRQIKVRNSEGELILSESITQNPSGQRFEFKKDLVDDIYSVTALDAKDATVRKDFEKQGRSFTPVFD